MGEDESGGEWSTVTSKGKAIPTGSPAHPPPAAAALCWASLFETPRQSPLSRPKSPVEGQRRALNVVAQAEPIVISWKGLQLPCRMRTRGLLNTGNMCFLNAVHNSQHVQAYLW